MCSNCFFGMAYSLYRFCIYYFPLTSSLELSCLYIFCLHRSYYLLEFIGAAILGDDCAVLVFQGYFIANPNLKKVKFFFVNPLPKLYYHMPIKKDPPYFLTKLWYNQLTSHSTLIPIFYANFRKRTKPTVWFRSVYNLCKQLFLTRLLVKKLQ